MCAICYVLCAVYYMLCAMHSAPWALCHAWCAVHYVLYTRCYVHFASVFLCVFAFLFCKHIEPSVKYDRVHAFSVFFIAIIIINIMLSFHLIPLNNHDWLPQKKDNKDLLVTLLTGCFAWFGWPNDGNTNRHNWLRARLLQVCQGVGHEGVTCWLGAQVVDVLSVDTWVACIAWTIHGLDAVSFMKLSPKQKTVHKR